MTDLTSYRPKSGWNLDSGDDNDDAVDGDDDGDDGDWRLSSSFIVMAATQLLVM